jgi:integrase
VTDVLRFLSHLGGQGKTLSFGTTYRVWAADRAAAFTDAEYVSPLARRPSDLRHAAVSLWLNVGVPPTQVAEWAGHSVNVLLKVYAKCIYGQDEVARTRIEAAPSRARGGR